MEEDKLTHLESVGSTSDGGISFNLSTSSYQFITSGQLVDQSEATVLPILQVIPYSDQSVRDINYPLDDLTTADKEVAVSNRHLDGKEQNEPLSDSGMGHSQLIYRPLLFRTDPDGTKNIIIEPHSFVGDLDTFDKIVPGTIIHTGGKIISNLNELSSKSTVVQLGKVNCGDEEDSDIAIDNIYTLKDVEVLNADGAGTFTRGDQSSDFINDTGQCSILLSAAPVSQSNDGAGTFTRGDQSSDFINDTGQCSILLSAAPLSQSNIDVLSPIGKGPWVCSKCGKVCRRWNLFTKHLAFHREEKPYKCEECSASFNVESNFKLHGALHSEATPMVCPECNKTFHRLAALKAHLSIHEEDETVVCSICQEEFFSELQLEPHMEEHNSPQEKKPIQKEPVCQKCGHTFVSLVALRTHMETHRRKRRGPLYTRRKQSNYKFFKECRTCEKYFVKPSQLERHMRTHTGERPFKCNYPMCGKSFSQKCTMLIHMAIHTGTKSYKCEYCKKAFVQRSNLLCHIKRVHPKVKSCEHVFECQKCPCVFKRPGSLNAHISKSHPSEILKIDCIPDDGRLREGPDSKTIIVDSGMMGHDQILDNQDKDIVQEALKDSGLRNEIKKESSEPVENSRRVDDIIINASNISDECKKAMSALNKTHILQKIEQLNPSERTKFSVMSLVDQSDSDHEMKITSVLVKLHDGTKSHLCMDINCNKEFKKPSDLMRHVRTHTNEKPFKCHKCYRAFTVKSTLNGHLKTHDQAREYSCDKCEKKFNTSNSLKVHSWSHDGTKPYRCDICGKQFRTISQRKTHYLSHNQSPYKQAQKNKNIPLPDIRLQEPYIITSEGTIQPCKPHFLSYLDTDGSNPPDRPHRCKYCPAAFKKSSHLKQHERGHTGERPFECSLCRKTFSSASVLKAHKKIHSGARPHECSICKKFFATSGSLRRHQTTHSSNRPIVCPYCRKTFKTLTNCKKHIKTHKRELSMKAIRAAGANYIGDAEQANLTASLYSSVEMSDSQQTPQIEIISGLDDFQDSSYPFVSTINEEPDDAGMSQFHEPAKPSFSSLLHSKDKNTASLSVSDKIRTGTFSEITPLPHISDPPDSLNSKALTLTSSSNATLLTFASADSLQPVTSASMTKLSLIHSSGDNDDESISRIGTQIPIAVNFSESKTQSRPVLTNAKHSSENLKCFELVSENIANAPSNDSCNTTDGSKALLGRSDINSEQANTDLIDSNFASSTMANNFVYVTPGLELSSLNQDELTEVPVVHLWCSLSKNEATEVPSGNKGNDNESMQILCKTRKPLFSDVSPQKKLNKEGSNSLVNILSTNARHEGCLSLVKSEKSFSCDVCFEEFDNSSALNDHVKEAHMPSDLQEHARKPNLRSHSVGKSQPEEQQIELKETYSQSSQKSRPRGKERRGRFMHQCTSCPKSFKKPSDLTRHIRTHTGEKPFSCIICNKSFAVKSTLYVHLRSHENRKDFACELCEALFSCKGSLKMHMRLHTGSRPLKCPHCEQSFRTSGHRKSHMLKHTKEKLLPKSVATHARNDSLSTAAVPVTEVDDGATFITADKMVSFHITNVHPSLLKMSGDTLDESLLKQLQESGASSAAVEDAENSFPSVNPNYVMTQSSSLIGEEAIDGGDRPMEMQIIDSQGQIIPADETLAVIDVAGSKDKEPGLTPFAFPSVKVWPKFGDWSQGVLPHSVIIKSDDFDESFAISADDLEGQELIELHSSKAQIGVSNVPLELTNKQFD